MYFPVLGMFASKGVLKMQCETMGTPFTMPLGSTKPTECTEPLPLSQGALQVPACHQLWKYCSPALSQASQSFQAFPQENVPNAIVNNT